MTHEHREDIAAYVAERNAALTAMDMEWARRQCPDLDDVPLLWGMHKARYECLHIDAALRHESAAFLRANNLKRYCGAPLLPEGELPQ